MKYIPILTLFLVLGFSNCASPKKTKSLNSIKYSATTRGASILIQIQEGSFTIQKINNIVQDQGESIIDPTTRTHWKELKRIVKTIPLDQITTLELPSAAFQYDGALATSLTIQIGDVQYISNTFDHKNPPKKLKELIDYIAVMHDEVSAKPF